MALAKVDALSVLFRLFPRIVTPPAVYEETVVAGQHLGAPDAFLLAACYEDRRLEVAVPPPILEPSRLGRGEEESIALAIEQRADWLLIDDLDARQAAMASFRAARVETQAKGTLGILVSVCQEGLLSQREAINYVNALSERPDVWVSPDLCRRVIEILSRLSL
jgi:uncharacterized protein